jgi:RNase P/RNase MRP subunit p29
MATNYPLVRLTNRAGNKVRYLRTAHHSTMGVATGAAVHSTKVTVPIHTPQGQYSMVVVANGIASDPVTVHVARPR